MALLFSFAASWISPQKFWPLAFFGLAFPVFFVLNLLFAVYWLFVKRIYMLVSLLPFIVGVFMPGSHLRFNKAAEENNNSNSIRVLTYNVNAYERDQWKGNNHFPHTTAFMEFFREEEPDILFLQEHLAYDDIEREIREEIQNSTGQTHYYLKKYYNTFETSQCIGIFSKHPFVRHGFKQSQFRERERTYFVFADIALPTDTVRAYSVHLQSNYLKKEGELFTKSPDITNRDYQKLLHEQTMSLTRKLKYAFQHRAVQVDELVAHIKDSPYPVILGGDFNDTPGSYTYSRINKLLKDSYRKRSAGKRYTYYGDFPSFRIDYIFHDNILEASNTRIVEHPYSDHYPVVTQLKMNTKP
ncbi:MAG: endonuclease/exonuclease/phosphatase family protein [Bacteroidales bacterium]